MTAHRASKRCGTLWQPRYWEHQIRNDADFQHHMDYLYFNPVKHGLVAAVMDWPYSTFHRMVGQGIYPSDWSDTGGIGARLVGTRKSSIPIPPSFQVVA